MSFFMFTRGKGGAGTIFGAGCAPSACHVFQSFVISILCKFFLYIFFVRNKVKKSLKPCNNSSKCALFLFII